jgi:predicted nucleotidyltransferase
MSPSIFRDMKISNDIKKLKEVLNNFKRDGKVLLAYLYGSYAVGLEHKRSDIDIAVYINTKDEKEMDNIIDAILMASDKPVEILRLDDEDESPFIVQSALKGMPLIEPDEETLYMVARRVLHEAEGIRYKRSVEMVA